MLIWMYCAVGIHFVPVCVLYWCTCFGLYLEGDSIWLGDANLWFVLVCKYLECNPTPLEVKLICFLLVGFKAFPKFCAVSLSLPTAERGFVFLAGQVSSITIDT